jgi:hypothetical protein
VAIANTPLKPGGPSGAASRFALGLAGVALCLVSVGVAFVTWSLLPAGRYPVIIAGLPALPLVWLAFRLFKKAGWVQEPAPEAAAGVALSAKPAPKGMSSGKLFLIGLAIVFALMVLAIPFLM